LVQEVRQRVRDRKTGEVSEHTIIRGVPVARVDALYNYQSPCDLLLDESKILPNVIIENRLPLTYNANFGRLPRNKPPAARRSRPGRMARDGVYRAGQVMAALDAKQQLSAAAKKAWGHGRKRPNPPSGDSSPISVLTEEGQQEDDLVTVTGSRVFWDCDIAVAGVPQPMTEVPERQKDCVGTLRLLFMLKPGWTIDALQEILDGRIIHYRVLDVDAGIYAAPSKFACKSVSFTVLKASLYYVAYQFRTGPFRKVWFRRGFDPRKFPLTGLLFQTVDYRISTEQYQFLPELCDEHKTVKDVASCCPPPLAGQVRYVLDGSSKGWVKKQPLVSLCDLAHPTITPIVNKRLTELRSMRKAGAGKLAGLFNEKFGFLTAEECVTIRNCAKTAVGSLLSQIEHSLRGEPVDEAELHPLIRENGLIAQQLVQAMEDDGVVFWKLEEG